LNRQNGIAHPYYTMLNMCNKLILLPRVLEVLTYICEPLHTTSHKNYRKKCSFV